MRKLSIACLGKLSIALVSFRLPSRKLSIACLGKLSIASVRKLSIACLGKLSIAQLLLVPFHNIPKPSCDKKRQDVR